MAKVKNCVFCGAEVTTGLFTGTAEGFELGQTLTVCPECKKSICKDIDKEKARITTKIENFKKACKTKLTEMDIATLCKKYLEEEKYYQEKNGSEKACGSHGFFEYNENGYFTVCEFKAQTNFLDDAEDLKGMKETLKALKKNDTFLFTKDDVTKLEYRFVSKNGITTGLFSQIHLFEIRLNDEKQFTYRPCITRMFVQGKGFFPAIAKKKAEAKLVQAMETFKLVTGSTLPIVKVKKFQ